METRTADWDSCCNRAADSFCKGRSAAATSAHEASAGAMAGRPHAKPDFWFERNMGRVPADFANLIPLDVQQCGRFGISSSRMSRDSRQIPAAHGWQRESAPNLCIRMREVACKSAGLTKAVAGNPASMSELWEIHMTIDSS